MRTVFPQAPALNPLALPFMLAASALVAATSLIAKMLGGGGGAEVLGLHPLQVSAGRFVFAFVTLMIVLLLCPRLRPTLRGAPIGLHVVRSVFGWLGVTAMFGAVAMMPLAEATAISFLNPLVTMGLAVVLLGEHLGARKVLAAALALIGAVCILKPGAEAFQSAGLLALAAAVFLGCEATVIKRLTNTEPALRVLILNNAIGATISVIAACFVWIWPTLGQWALLILLGVVMVSAQACFIQSMTRADASRVMPVFYSVLVFAAVYDFALYAVIPDALALIGGGLIICSALVLARR